MKIALTSIPVDSPVKAFHFYTEILGFKEQLFTPEANLAVVVSPEDPNSTGLLLEPNDNPIYKEYQQGLYKQDLPVIVLGVEDIHKEYNHLKEKGVRFLGDPVQSEAGWTTVFDDTCGNYVQLHQV